MNYLVTLQQILSEDKKIILILMRHSLFFITLLTVVLFSSCGGSQGSKESAEALADSLSADSLAADSLEEDFSQVVVPKAADELFDDFVFNFAVNNKMQKERIVFPLKVVDEGKTTYIQRKDWKMDHFFMRQGFYVLLFDSEAHMEIVKDTSVTHAVVERISYTKENIRQYVFNRIRGTWMMTSINEIALKESRKASFLAFYYQFASDPKFQATHLENTVAFIGPDPDDDFSQMEGIITPDTWEAFAPLLPKKKIYNIIYGHPTKEGNQKVYVLRGIANGLEMQMNFRRRNDTWRLYKLST